MLTTKARFCAFWPELRIFQVNLGTAPESVFRVRKLQDFGSQMSRTRLKQLVVDLYRSSAEFRADFNDQINKSGFMQKRAQFMPINGDPRLGLFGTVPNESMFDRWCFSHSQGANCGSHRSHTRLPAVQGS
jgi:hypothetical protein